jgi:hypothetical protein
MDVSGLWADMLRGVFAELAPGRRGHYGASRQSIYLFLRYFAFLCLMFVFAARLPLR